MAYTYNFSLGWTIPNNSPYYALPESDPPSQTVRKDRDTTREAIVNAVSAVTDQLGPMTFQTPQTEAQLLVLFQGMIDSNSNPTWTVGGPLSSKSEWVWRNGRWVEISSYALMHDGANFSINVETVAGDVTASYELKISV